MFLTLISLLSVLNLSILSVPVGEEWLQECLAGLRELEEATANIEMQGEFRTADVSAQATFAVKTSKQGSSALRDYTATQTTLPYRGRVEVITPEFTFILDRDEDLNFSLRDSAEVPLLNADDQFRFQVRKSNFIERFVCGTWLLVHTFTPLSEALTSDSCTIESAGPTGDSGDWEVIFRLADGEKGFLQDGSLRSFPTRTRVVLRPEMNWSITRSEHTTLIETSNLQVFTVDPTELESGLIVADSCRLVVLPPSENQRERVNENSTAPNFFEEFHAEHIKTGHLNDSYFLPERYGIPNHLVGIKPPSPLWTRWWVWLIVANVGCGAWWLARLSRSSDRASER